LLIRLDVDLSQERVFKALTDLGLSQLDAKVYVFLGKRGLQKGQDIARGLKVNKQQIYRSLKNLQDRGIVSVTFDHPARYSAEPFQKVIDLFIRAKMEDAQRLKQSKDSILSDWQSIAIAETHETSAKFTVFKGRNHIYSKLKQMVEATKYTLSIISDVPGLVHLDQFGLLDRSFNYGSKSKIQFRFLTEPTHQNLNFMKSLLERKHKTAFSFEGRTPDLGLKLFSRMIISDNKEAIFFINSGTERTLIEQDDLCFWTNCKSIVDSFAAVFEELWSNSTSIQKKIVEIETGKPIPQTCVLGDRSEAKRKYNEVVCSAMEELLIITSSRGLVELPKNLPMMRNLYEKKVSIKIMAPITGENISTAKTLAEFYEVKHIPATYLRTTLIDGKHLFQFKTPQHDMEQMDPNAYFDNAIYTNDTEHVEKTRIMLLDIWNRAHPLFVEKIETAFGPPVISFISPVDENRTKAYKSMFNFIEDIVYLGPEAQKDILNRFVSAKRISPKDPKNETITLYGSMAQAFLHFPENFNLPAMVIQIYCHNEQSSFGADNWLTIYCKIETKKGFEYVPVVYVGTNPQTEAMRKLSNAGTPTEHNRHLLTKDEFEVRVQGNTLFACWTKPIPLFPPTSILPPACILFEGYGDLRTSKAILRHRSGRLQIHEQNEFEAFATFFHPSSKLSFPGTEALFLRDSIFTTVPSSEEQKYLTPKISTKF
jgi:hypothetical protein